MINFIVHLPMIIGIGFTLMCLTARPVMAAARYA